ncbi:MAG: hypothetical protein KKB20_26190 [Proteobacteria bacterium]|nr:hypothetical protein [Pseudomonadota bacterium]
MALQKNYTLPNGVVGSYWRADGVLVRNGQGVAYLSLYLDEPTRRNGAEPLVTRHHTLDGFTVEAMSEAGYNPYKIAYEQTKAGLVLDGDYGFDDAEDV